MIKNEIKTTEHAFAGIQQTVAAMKAVIVAEVISGERCLPYPSGYRMLAHSVAEGDSIFSHTANWWENNNGFIFIPVQEKLKFPLALSCIYLGKQTTHLVIPSHAFWNEGWLQDSVYLELRAAIVEAIS